MIYGNILTNNYKILRRLCEMEFNDKIKQFSERVVKIKDTALTEESTKMSLIVPLFQILGYDVFNPLEFCPEYTADVGIKKGEK